MLMALTCAHVPVDVGEFVQYDLHGLGLMGHKSPGINETTYAYVPLETDPTAETGTVDNRTHYHYDY